MADVQSEQKQNGNGSIVLKYWQVIFITLVQLAGLAYAYGKLSQDVSNTKEQVNDLKSRVEDARIVSRDEFNDFRQEMRNSVRDLHTAILSVK